jgi:hypothetical protein
MRNFFKRLFVRHQSEVFEPVRHCTTCGRREIEEMEQSEFADTLEWNCFDPGDVTRHWQ